MKESVHALPEAAPTISTRYTPDTAESIAVEQASIVLVEDDSDTRELLAELLQQEGYRVTTARNGVDALSKLTEGVAPHLIILDLNMPGLNGADFAHRLLHEPTYGRVPLLVVSGSETGRQEAALLGADAFLRKPLQPDALLEQVGHLLEQG